MVRIRFQFVICKIMTHEGEKQKKKKSVAHHNSPHQHNKISINYLPNRLTT